MPLYEGISTDKHCVILDIGHAYTKCGFAREPGPRWILPSEIKATEKSKALKIWNYKNETELFETLKEFLHVLYFRYLVVNPKDRRVVIVESVLCPTEFRETLAKVLFTHFEVPSVLFLPSHLMAIYALGVSSAIVVDIGYSETVILPKVPILNAWEAVPLGAQAIHRRLEAELMDRGEVKGLKSEVLPLGSVLNEPEPLPENIFEDVKVRTCFVSPPHRSAALQEFYYSQAFPSSRQEEKPPAAIEFIPALNVDYPLDGQKILNIPGLLREAGPEVLFEQDSDGQSVVSVLLDSILRCPIDIRKSLMENIVLMGGTAMLSGFKHRFMGEIKRLLASEKYSKRLPLKTVKMHKPPAKENYVAWLGGAIFGATDAVATRSVTREQYLNKGRINDWSDQEWIDTIGK